MLRPQRHRGGRARRGAEVVLPQPRFFKKADLGGEVLGEWPVLEPFLDADRLINVPIAKHHSLTGVTLGMKNWYGLIGGDRNRLHQRIHESLVDLTGFAKPTLTIMDAWRVLMRNGPTGGSEDDVETKADDCGEHRPGGGGCVRGEGLVGSRRAAAALPAPGRVARPRPHRFRVA